MRLSLLRGSAKVRLRSEIEELQRVAVRQGGAGLDERQRLLWGVCCREAADVTAELVVQNTDKRVDWGLKRHRKRLDGRPLAVVYWWVVLYEIVLFRGKGVEGYDTVADFEALADAGEGLMEMFVGLPQVGGEDADMWSGRWEQQVGGTAGVWNARWRQQVAIEAAMDMYNGIMGMLGVGGSLEARAARVSLFGIATEQGFQAAVDRVFLA